MGLNGGSVAMDSVPTYLPSRLSFILPCSSFCLSCGQLLLLSLLRELFLNRYSVHFIPLHRAGTRRDILRIGWYNGLPGRRGWTGTHSDPRTRQVRHRLTLVDTTGSLAAGVGLALIYIHSPHNTKVGHRWTLVDTAGSLATEVGLALIRIHTLDRLEIGEHCLIQRTTIKVRT